MNRLNLRAWLYCQVNYFKAVMNRKPISKFALPLLCAALLAQSALAAGQIDLVEGGVGVVSPNGQLRVPKKGERIEAGDSITTSKDGEIHVHMDDDGYVALRPNTFLKIDAYKAEGGADDAAVFRLIAGSFRSITGWIGKISPKNYAVITPTSTIGVRGTDHETLVVESGENAGTYDKVTSGETEMVTSIGKVSVLPGQAAFVPKTGAPLPKVLAVVPAVFQPTKNEASIDKIKVILDGSREDRREKKLKENIRKGVGADGKPKIGDPRDARKALKVFEEFLRAFEAGDVATIRQKLDPSMIGYQQLLDNITQENNECKQMRVSLFDTQVQAGPDLAVLQTGWEKRCLLAPSFTPKLTSGRSTILLHLGAGSSWNFAAITGGNMLERSASFTKVLATLQVTNTGASFALASVLPGQTALPFSITVTDPDRAGAAAVTVVVTSPAPANDSLTLTLPAIAPGSSKFRVSTVNFSRAGGGLGCGSALASNPSSLEICATTTATVSYTDNTTPSGVPQTVTQSVSVP
jgi:hypothetical protein